MPYISAVGVRVAPSIGWRGAVALCIGAALLILIAGYVLGKLRGVDAWVVGISLFVLAVMAFVWAAMPLSFLDGGIMLGCWVVVVGGVALWLHRSQLPFHRRHLVQLVGRSDSFSGASGTLSTFTGVAAGTVIPPPTPWESVQRRVKRWWAHWRST